MTGDPGCGRLERCRWLALRPDWVMRPAFAA